MTDPTRHFRWVPQADQTCAAAWLALAAWCLPALAQSSPKPAEVKPPEAARPISYGVEIALSSGHADRGFVINDRPVVQPVAWVSVPGASFYLWGNLPLVQTTDGARPLILEMEMSWPHEWGNLSIAPAIRVFLYHDPLSRYTARSIEGWLNLSYDAGPFSLFTRHSIDVLAYRGAYFGEAGIEVERRVSPRVELGGAFGGGWASAGFNDAWVGIRKSAFNRISGEGWLVAYLTSHSYVGPLLRFSTIVDGAVRAELGRPTFVFVGLTTGVEF